MGTEEVLQTTLLQQVQKGITTRRAESSGVFFGPSILESDWLTSVFVFEV